jgi:hypothetical protein
VAIEFDPKKKVLKAYLARKEKPLTAEVVRKIVREELAANS